MRALDPSRSWSSAAALVAAFAAVTAGWGLAGWVQLSPLGADAPQILPLALAHLRNGEARLVGLRAPSRQALVRAEHEFALALAQEPANTKIWLDLASVSRLQDGGYSPRVRDAIAGSYRVGPMDPGVSYWRLWFCYEGWPNLPPEVKRSVLREVDALWSTPDSQDQLRDLSSRVRDPAGRAALTAELTRLALFKKGRAGIASGAPFVVGFEISGTGPWPWSR